MLELAWRFARWMKPVFPAAWVGFFTEVRREHPYTDRSEVVLYTDDPSLLSTYTPRQGTTHAASRTPLTLVATLRNEAKDLPAWLDALQNQTRQPDEVVLVDGGSTDGGPEIIRGFASQSQLPIRLVEAPGANIARGRNLAVKQAAHALVACTDCGCRMQPDWLERLVQPFEQDQAVVLSAGYYTVQGHSLPARLAHELLGIDPVRLDPQAFYPSGRSLAFRKDFFELAGRYPEWLSDAGEDTLFAYRAKGHPGRWAFVPQAQVNWHAPETLPGLLGKIRRYAAGDGEAATNARLYRYKLVQVARAGLRGLALAGSGLLLALLFVRAVQAAPGAGFVFWLGWMSAWLVGGLLQNLPEDRQAAQRMRMAYFPYSVLLEIVGWLQALGYLQGVRRRPRLYQRQVALLQDELDEILKQHPDQQVIIYPPTHDWGFMFQRPHQVARFLARAGYLYFYGTANEMTDAVYGFRQVEPGLYLFHAPLVVFNRLEKPVVVIGSPWHAASLAAFNSPRLVYDHYDDLAVSGGRLADHQALLQTAEVVLVTSRRLVEQLPPGLRTSQRVVLMPNGVDLEWIERFRPTPSTPAPPGWLPQPGQRVIGYSGALASWVDYDLLSLVAESHPQDCLLLVGVDYDGSLSQAEAGRRLLALPNVHWLGMKPYSELFPIMWRFDVGIIPFKLNEITLAASPIKLFEYLACELPVVATALPECRQDADGRAYPGVRVAEGPREFLQILDECLEIRRDAGQRLALRQTAQANSWQVRLAPLIDKLNGGLEKPVK